MYKEKPPEKKIEEVGAGFKHWVSHFLLLSRAGGIYAERDLEETKKAIEDILPQVKEDEQLKEKLEELLGELNLIEAGQSADEDKLNRIEEIQKEIVLP